MTQKRIFRIEPYASSDFYHLRNNNKLITTRSNSEYYLCFANGYDFCISVEKTSDGFYAIRKWEQKPLSPREENGCFLFKSYSEFVYPSHLDKYEEHEYLYDDLDEVIQAINKYFYEIY